MIIWDIILGFPCEIQIINYVMNHHDDYAEHNSEFPGEIQRDQNQFYDFHFFKSASTLEKKKSAIFSYPSTLLPAWWSNTSWIKITQFKLKLNWILLPCSVQSLLQGDQRPQNAHASAQWKEVPQLQPVRLLNHQCFEAEKPHAGSQWRETFQLQTMQLFLHNSK